MPTDRRLIIVAVLAGLAALIAFGELWPRDAPAAAVPPLAVTAPRAVEPAQQPAVVHVVGAVHRPGVYRLAPGARVRDAVRRAGGPTKAALLSGVNLAQRLADGEQVVVPAKAVGTAIGAATAGPGAAVEQIVHLNSATAEQLDALDGIGPALAQRIVDYRVGHGGFRSLDELDDVSGIGPARLESLRARLAL